MPNRSRDYGLEWERILVNRFKEFDSKSHRTPNSGAFGTLAGIDSLKGDVRFSIDGMHFLIEAKAGYGGSKSITLQREWMDKVIEEATGQRPKRIPILALKMKGCQKESGKLIVFTLDTFLDFLAEYDKILSDLMQANDFIYALEDKEIVERYIKGNV